MSKPVNFQNIQASRTLNKINKQEIVDFIQYLIIHYYTVTQRSVTGDDPQVYELSGKNKYKLPFGGQCNGFKGPQYNFDNFPEELQDLIKNFLIYSSK